MAARRIWLIALVFLTGCGTAGSVLKPVVHVSCEVARAAVQWCPAAEAVVGSGN